MLCMQGGWEFVIWLHEYQQESSKQQSKLLLKEENGKEKEMKDIVMNLSLIRCPRLPLLASVITFSQSANPQILFCPK